MNHDMINPDILAGSAPILYETARTRIRRFFFSDVDAAYMWYSDPDAARYQFWDVYTYEKTREEIAELSVPAPVSVGHWNCFAIARKSDDLAIGFICIKVSDEIHRQAELGWTLARPHQGQGYAFEAALGMVHFGVKWGVHRFFATTDVRNAPSIRLMEKLGMKREAHFRENWFVKGEWCDEYVYAILARDIPTTADPGR